MITNYSLVVAVNEQVSCDLNGETVILHLGDGIYYGLDSVGSRVWELIQEPRYVQEVRDTLLEEYEVEPEHCERDLMALLEELAKRRLVLVKRDVNGAVPLLIQDETHS